MGILGHAPYNLLAESVIIRAFSASYSRADTYLHYRLHTLGCQSFQ
jgi:hypothetical protein